MEIDIMQFAKAGLVVGVVGVIQLIKTIIEDSRAKALKAQIDSRIWLIVVAVSGIIMAVISAGIDSAWTIWTLIRDAFIYSAAAAYVYRLGKAAGGK